MRTKAIRILAGLMAAALPTLALAQDTTQAAGGGFDSFVEVADNVDSENLRLHTVQRKPYADGGRHEVVLYPVVAQINGKFTDHMGVGAQYLYHLHENFALQALGQFFYVNEQTEFTKELLKGDRAPQAATALTLHWAATAGFEVTPIYGKFSFYEGNMAHFGVVLTGGAGVGGTRIQLVGDEFGSTGMKFVGQVGAGFRVRLNENFLVRLEVKDLIYTAKVDSINGCNLSDLNALSANSSAQTSGSCSGGSRFSRPSGSGWTSVSNAKSLVEDASSDVLNNVGVYGGVSYSF